MPGRAQALQLPQPLREGPTEQHVYLMVSAAAEQGATPQVHYCKPAYFLLSRVIS